jgi:hypothetical protein
LILNKIQGILNGGIKSLLKESEVIKAVCQKLRTHGYKITQQLGTSEHGDDIIADKKAPTPCQLYVEAKGETSSRRGSKRFGKQFNGSQIRSHISQALFKAAQALSRKAADKEIRAGIALPDNQGHRAVIKRIEPFLKQIEIAIFWVKENGEVEVMSGWFEIDN